MNTDNRTPEQWTEFIKSIMRESIATEVYDLEKCKNFIDRTVAELAEEYMVSGFEHTIEYHNGWKSCAGSKFRGSWSMKFGAESIEYFFTNGPLEYKRIQKMLDTRGLNELRGYAGLKILVLHEFAHVVQYHTNESKWSQSESSDYGYTPGKWTRSVKPHGPEFKSAYAELLDNHAGGK
jgi:hypothetical protein